MTTWIYNFSVYDNESAALDAVTALKNELDNMPTTYVEVKLLSGNAVDGWVVPTERLTDDQINAGLDADSFYNVSAIAEGITHVGISGTDATTKILEIRRLYAQRCSADVIRKEYAPTNHDMSGYV